MKRLCKCLLQQVFKATAAVSDCGLLYFDLYLFRISVSQIVIEYLKSGSYNAIIHLSVVRHCILLAHNWACFHLHLHLT